MYNQFDSLIGDDYITETFEDIFPDLETFETEYAKQPESMQNLESADLEILYNLLMAEYATSHIKSFSVTQFEYKVFSIMFTDGPIWAKRLEVQKAIRDLDITSDDITKGTTAIYNHAQNPAVTPSTDTLEELTYIDNQNTTKYKYGKVDSLIKYYEVIGNDVTKNFIKQFAKLFISVCVSVPVDYKGI